jgi:hypothetical protein
MQQVSTQWSWKSKKEQEEIIDYLLGSIKHERCRIYFISPVKPI